MFFRSSEMSEIPACGREQVAPIPGSRKDQDAEWRSRIERTDESAHETARHCERKDHSISAWPREGNIMAKA